VLLRKRIGKWLASKDLRKGDLGRIARKLGVKVRTLNNWRRAAGRPLKRQGRPPATYAERRWTRTAVAGIIKRQGWIGWRTMVLSLPFSSVSVVKWALADLKLGNRRKTRKRLARRRTHYHYTHKGVVLAQDSACVGVAYDGKVWVEAQKDPATSLGEAFGDGAPVTTDRVIEHLEELKEYGLLPLIFQTDNNKAYCSDRAEQWLQAEQVIHLISRPHTPQDNAAIERLIGEMKSDRIFPLNANTSHFTRAGGVSTAAEIVELLNSERPRPSKGGKTAAQLTSEVPGWSIAVERGTFYKETRQAIEAAKQGLKGIKARTAEREAIFQSLEKFGLLVRTRGDGSVSQR